MNELSELVNEPISDEVACLDIEDASKGHPSDDQVMMLILQANALRLMLLRNNYIEYDSDREMSNLFSKWTKDINSYRDIRIEAIVNYCGYVHEKINGFLRGTAKIGPFSNYLYIIQTMLSAAPLLPNNTILYRALPLHVIKTILSEMDIQGIYREKGFLSTSLNLNGIMNFVKSINDIKFDDIDFQVLKLYVTQGTPALYVEDVEGSGMGRGELEMILPRGATIKKLRSPYWDERFSFWIHECTLEYDGLH